MTTPATADMKPRRRGFSPRFSLKMLMLAVTAAAVAAAFWWRWPVTQTTENKQGSRVTMETFTYHRGLRGNLIKHGVHRTMIDGEVDLEEYYREGVLHGPYRRSGIIIGEYYLGKQHGTWEFLPRPDEVRDLTPTTYDDPFGGPPRIRVKPKDLPAHEAYRVEEHWNRGKRDGLFQWWDHTGKLCFSHEFKNDRLVNPQHNPMESLLLKRIANGSLKDQKLQHTLLQRCDVNYVETPLQEVLEDCHDRFGLRMAARWRRKTVVLMPPEPPHEPPLPTMHEIPFSDDWILLTPDNPLAAPQLVDMRPRSLARPDPLAPLPPVVKNIFEAPISLNVSNGPLYAGFDAMLSPIGLVLDYRYGVLCIVDAANAESWRDMTGVMELRPSPATLLATRLDCPPKPTCLAPLRDVLRNLAADQEMPVEFRPADDPAAILDSIPQDEMVGLFREVITLRNSPMDNPKEPLPITLRQLLGLILDQANLRCHEENGVLIIEPPKKETATQVNASLP